MSPSRRHEDVPAASVEPLNTALKEAAIREILPATGGAVNGPPASTGRTVGAVTGGVVGTATGMVGGLTGTATGVTGGLTGAVSGAVGGLAPVPVTVVAPPGPLVKPVLNTVTTTTSTVTNELLSGLKR